MRLDVKVGTPVQVSSLSLYPLLSDRPRRAAYLPGPAAEAAGVLDVEELDDGAEVPQLLLTNAGDLPVLVVEGEMLLGAKQNRTLNLSVLCPPKARLPIPVSCVEAGRWGRPQGSRRSAYHANLNLRRAKTVSTVRHARAGLGRMSDQAAVWSEVDRSLDRAGMESPTAALEDAFDGVAPRQAPDVRPVTGQVGVVTALDGRPVALDLFDRPEVLDAYWEALVAGYALDAEDTEPCQPGAVCEVEAFLAAVTAAPVSAGPAVGLGEELLFESDTVAGAGLRWDGALVHLSAYALDRTGGEVAL